MISVIHRSASDLFDQFHNAPGHVAQYRGALRNALYKSTIIIIIIIIIPGSHDSD